MIQHSFDSADKYIMDTDDLKTKIDRINQIINGLLTMSASAATTGNIAEYSLDDGQTKIKTAYRSMNEVAASITSFQNLRKIFISEYNNTKMGRVRRLVDSKNFNRLK